eukprot:COSAG06_NODE_17971_length_905_cov_2.245376_1_plen_107_part_00
MNWFSRWLADCLACLLSVCLSGRRPAGLGCTAGLRIGWEEPGIRSSRGVVDIGPRQNAAMNVILRAEPPPLLLPPPSLVVVLLPVPVLLVDVSVSGGGTPRPGTTP